ncbi:phosphotransferase [Actinopolymorpha alba]|uniref:phosphotransferase n=1 Tax=Actinopolymorpha alba TaxID=533267 RepID=UPI00035E8EDB|nr:phosphotransferase [Actinopolymorpha alba]
MSGDLARDGHAWLEMSLGSSVRRLRWSRGHLSRVSLVELSDGRRVVLKVRPWADRLLDCGRAQSAAAAEGIACPRVLAGPEHVAGQAYSAEEWIGGGRQLAATRAHASRFAAGLRDLVEALRGCGSDRLAGAPLPWVGWRHDGTDLWPPPDDFDADLNEHTAVSWLDDAARHARELILSASLDRVIGHGDWESQNLRWMSSALHCVYDWDSLVYEPEAALAGAAAAVYVARGGPGQAATFEQTAAFLDAYSERLPRGFTPTESGVAWAAGVWVRAFNAKKALVAASLGLPSEPLQLATLRSDLEHRLAVALRCH